MIVVTRLSGSPFAINPDLIERIVENPDTTIFLVDGSSHIVTESLQTVIALIRDARAELIALASTKRIDPAPAQRHLEAVAPLDTIAPFDAGPYATTDASGGPHRVDDPIDDRDAPGGARPVRGS